MPPRQKLAISKKKKKKKVKASQPSSSQTLAWGMSILAYLYRQLGYASRSGARQISGCLSLLMAWIYDHFPMLHTSALNESFEPNDPALAKWKVLKFGGDPSQSMIHIREQLDELEADDVNFVLSISRMNMQVSGEDRISALPDDIICNILSNLYVEESARTSILCKQWRDMWLLSPITISDESIVKQSSMCCRAEEEPRRIYCVTKEESYPWIVNVMSHIISTHSGPIHTCHFILPDWYEYHKTLVNLLKTLTLKGIRNLQIDIGRFELPCFVLECDSLVNFHLRFGSMPAQLPAHSDIFPNLRKLSLLYYDINSEFLVNLLSSRPIIELAIHPFYDINNVVIESESLQKFYFGCHDYRKLTIKDAPNLETFKCAMGKSLQLGNYQFDVHSIYGYIEISGEITYMPSLRSLEIAVNFDRSYEVKSFLYILMCFPRLETLEVCVKSNAFFEDEYYKVWNIVAANADSIVVDDRYLLPPMLNIDCLNHHLKNVRVNNYTGRRAHLSFVKFIIANANVLETLTIVYGDAFNERMMKFQKHCLMKVRASKMVLVEFLKGK